MSRTTLTRRTMRPWSIAIPAALCLAAPAAAQQTWDDWEYEPGEGYHEEEWYDPSDWFDWGDDQPGIDYERDDWWNGNWGYDQEYYYDGGRYGYGGEAGADEVGYDEGYYDDEWFDVGEDEFEDAHIYDEYVYSDYVYDEPHPRGEYGFDGADNQPDQQAWEDEQAPGDQPLAGYGNDVAEYPYDDATDYGYHYEWDPVSGEWEPDYGYHTSTYEFDRPARYQDDGYSRAAPGNERFETGGEPTGGARPDGLSEQPARQREAPRRRSPQREAQQQQQQQQQQQRQLQQDGRRVAQNGAERQVLKGTVQEHEQVSGPGADGQRTLLRVRLQDGDSAVIDLGARQSVDDLNLRAGDQFMVIGQQRSIDGRTVLTAERLRVDGRTIQLDQRRQAQRGQPPRARQPRQQSSHRQPGQASTGETVTLSGQVEDYRRVTLQGQPDAHTFIRLRLQNGRAAVVNLGPRVDLQQLDLRQGDRITVQGVRGTVNDRPVLRAQHLRLDGQTFRQVQQRTVQQQRPQVQQRGAQRPRQRPMQQQSAVMLQGTVEDRRQLTLRGQNQPHQLVRLRTQDGRTVVVDLGPVAGTRRLNLRATDAIQVGGRWGRINERPVLMADRVQIAGRTYRLDRRGMPSPQGGGMGQGVGQQQNR